MKRNTSGLKPFPKGKSGNPNGRPKKIPELHQLLADVLSKEKDGKTSAQRILEALQTRALRGDVRAAEVLLDRGWGKPEQKINQITEMTINVKRK